MRVDARACINVFGKVIAIIIDDSRSGMSDVASHTAPLIGGLFVLETVKHEAISSVEYSINDH